MTRQRSQITIVVCLVMYLLYKVRVKGRVLSTNYLHTMSVLVARRNSVGAKDTLLSFSLFRLGIFYFSYFYTSSFLFLRVLSVSVTGP